MSEREKIAGLSLKGGRKDLFYFCLLEHYKDQDRWFLRSILKVKDQDSDGNEAIKKWIDEFSVTKMIVDFPLSNPPCFECQLECPGSLHCADSEVKEIQKRINNHLDEDHETYTKDPKKYERERNKNDLVDFFKDPFDKETYIPLLSRSFKRRLKKGFLPYWNRPLDYWVWKYYYDQLLEIFNISYDSFGNTSLMLMSRFNYLKRHFSTDLQLHEGNTQICLIELLRSKIIMKRDIDNLLDIEMKVDARLQIIREIEKHLKIFIYDSDLELIVTNPRAFESFLLALIGQRSILGDVRKLPNWALPKETRFVAPVF